VRLRVPLDCSNTNQDVYAGQERFRSLGSSFYRGSDAVLLLYSTVSPTSLESLRTWLDEFRNRCPVEEDEAGDFPWVAVGTKMDLWVEGASGSVGMADVEALLAELVPKGHQGRSEGYTVDEVASPTPSRSRTDHLHPAVDPNAGTIRTSWTSTTSSIYHTPSSSLDGSISSDPDDSTSTIHPASTASEDEDPETILGHREAEEERRRGVDIFMSSSPPRAPSTLGRKYKSFRGHLVQSHLDPGDTLESRKQEGMKHFRTSAKSGEGVQEVFEYVIRKVRRKWAREDRDRELVDAQEAQEARSIEVGVQQKRGGLRGACCG
jgi:Ras-related protein Rab-7A